MEIEYIDNDMIKVLVSPEELERRGISFIDLVGDYHHVEELFYAVLKEADIEDRFRDLDSLTFQIVPTSNGIELYISRGDFDQPMGKEFMEYLRKRISKANLIIKERKQKEAEAAVQKIDGEEVFVFQSLDALISAAKTVTKLTMKADVYYNEGTYYVVFLKDGELSDNFSENYQFMQFMEYSIPVTLPMELLMEHTQLIRSGDGLEFFAQM